MDAKMKMRRFCFIGSLEPAFAKLRGLVDVHNYWPKLSILSQQLDYDSMLAILKEALLECITIRYDEPLFAYACYLSADVNISWKTKLREDFPQLVVNDHNLFLFLYYAKQIQKERGRANYSRTVRKAVVSWYKHSTIELDQFLCATKRGYFGLSHKKIIKDFYITDALLQDKQVADKFFLSTTEFIKKLNKRSASQSSAESKSKSDTDGTSTSTANAVSEKSDDSGTGSTESAKSSSNEEMIKKSSCKVTVDVIPNDINSNDNDCNSTSSKDSEELRKWNSVYPKTPVEGMARLHIVKSKFEAFKIIRKFEFPYYTIPPKLMEHNVILSFYLSRMPYVKVLERWRHLGRTRKLDNEKILNVCESILKDKSLIGIADLHPIKFLFTLCQCGGRFNLEKLPENRVQRMKLKNLRDLYISSFGMNKPTGMRMHITINLQNRYRAKFLRNYKKLHYFEAAVAFAFGYFKVEEQVDVFHWTESITALGAINWEKKFNIEEAMEKCIAIQNLKNQQRLVAPIIEALRSRKYYDVFIVIVPTAGRGNPGQRPDFLWKFLDRYRTTMDLDTKFVIVNLIKTRKSMQYSDSVSQNILEICGLDSYTPQLIKNFVNKRFY